MASETPKVSVVVPVYNTRATVGATLESLRAQTFGDFEVIVVNDGSTDDSMEVCRAFEDARVRIVEQENRGLAGARNTGLREARGELVGFLDSDDHWLPEKLERHVAQFEADPDLGLAYSHSVMMDDDGEDLIIQQREGVADTGFADIYTRNVLGNGSNAVLRRAVFTGRPREPSRFPALTGFDEELRRAEDFELWCRIAALTDWKIRCLPEALVRYRMNRAGLSANTLAQRKYHLLAMAKVAAYAPERAEIHRHEAVAHLYWHQARTRSRNGEARMALRAARFALYYAPGSLNLNHFFITCAAASAAVLPRRWYPSALKLASRAWGRWQRLGIGPGGGGRQAPESPAPPLEEQLLPPPRYERRGSMPNLFFVSHRHRLMFLSVSKNASTSLKKIMYREEFGHDANDEGKGVHEAWGWRATPGKSLSVDDHEGIAAYPDYRRFVVWRDPVSRFLSAYHNRVLFAEFEHPFYLRKRLEGMGLEQFINVTERVLQIDNPLHMDEHLRPQHLCYDPSDVQDIVPIQHLKAYLLSQFGIATPPPLNETVLPRLPASEKQLARIRALYAKDYEIEPGWTPAQAPAAPG